MTEDQMVSSEVEVAVDPDTAFAAFTEELDLWWVRGPINHFAGGRALAMRCEPGCARRDSAPQEVRARARLALGISYARPAAAARWPASAFGFTSPDPLPEGNDPLPSESGHGHPWIEFRLGDSSLMIFKLEAPDAGEGRQAVHTPGGYVDDIDAHYGRARSDAGTIVTEPGRRSGRPV